MFKFVCFALLFVLSATLFSLRVEIQIDDPQLLELVSRNIREVAGELEELFGFSLSSKVVVQLGERSSSRLGFVQMGREEYVVVLSVAEAFHRTLRHEMMHVYLDSWARRRSVDVPLWVHEGFANWFEAAAGYRTLDLVLSGWPPLDPLSFQDYPEDDRLSSYYVYVTDLFFALDSRINFRDHLGELLSLVEEGDTWREAFAKMLGDDFESFYRVWKWRAYSLAFSGWAMKWAAWLVGPILLMVFVLKRMVVRKDYDVTPEELEELERIYGERFWEKEDGGT